MIILFKCLFIKDINAFLLGKCLWMKTIGCTLHTCSALVDTQHFSVFQTEFGNSFFYVYFWERERERAQAGKGQREKRDRGYKTGSTLAAESPMWGPNSWTLRSWSQLKLDTTEPPKQPRIWEFWLMHFAVNSCIFLPPLPTRWVFGFFLCF